MGPARRGELARLVAILENDLKHLSERVNRIDKRLWALVLLVVTGGIAGPLVTFLTR
jgi:hypothetical protein